MFAWLCWLYEWNLSLHRLRWFLKLHKIKFHTHNPSSVTQLWPFYHTTVKVSSTVKSPCGVQWSFLRILPKVIIVRNSSCGKVMFSQACVKNSVHRGGGVHPLGRHPLADTDTPPPSLDGHCSGRYASYLNAFLYYLKMSLSLCVNEP